MAHAISISRNFPAVWKMHTGRIRTAVSSFDFYSTPCARHDMMWQLLDESSAQQKSHL